jgi:hypothetical protein
MVCDKDFEIRQPQDFVRGKADMQVPPFTRPEQSNTFLPLTTAWQIGEDINLLEVLAKNFTRVVPDSYEYTDSGDQALGARYLGEMSLGSDSVFKTMASMLKISTIVLFKDSANHFRDRVFINPYVDQKVMHVYKYKTLEGFENTKAMQYVLEICQSHFNHKTR